MRWFMTWSSRRPSTLLSCFNLSNVMSAGMRMLSVLYALSACGSAWRSISPIFGAICFYTGNLNNRCMRADHFVRSYPDIGHLRDRLYKL
uniref:Uncharacterized protein n=1 Tax=Oryza glumipatula TaxID=40148 RepID=A0A0E0ACH1_9ORYZ